MGDLSGASRSQIENRHLDVYGQEKGRGYVSLWRVWLDMKPGDKVICRYGLKEVVGIGTVVGKPFYNLVKGKEWADGLLLGSHPNFLPISWEEYSCSLGIAVFQKATISELEESDVHWETVRNRLSNIR